MLAYLGVSSWRLNQAVGNVGLGLRVRDELMAEAVEYLSSPVGTNMEEEGEKKKGRGPMREPGAFLYLEVALTDRGREEGLKRRKRLSRRVQCLG